MIGYKLFVSDKILETICVKLFYYKSLREAKMVYKGLLLETILLKILETI